MREFSVATMIVNCVAIALLPLVSTASVYQSAGTKRSILTPVPISTQNTTCTSTFKDIAAQDFIAALNPGWNLGNTLDAPEYEGVWNNPPVVEATFDDVKQAGFNSVRLPGEELWRFNAEIPH